MHNLLGSRNGIYVQRYIKRKNKLSVDGHERLFDM